MSIHHYLSIYERVRVCVCVCVCVCACVCVCVRAPLFLWVPLFITHPGTPLYLFAVVLASPLPSSSSSSSVFFFFLFVCLSGVWLSSFLFLLLAGAPYPCMVPCTNTHLAHRTPHIQYIQESTCTYYVQYILLLL